MCEAAKSSDVIVRELEETDIPALNKWRPGRRHSVYWALHVRGSITHLAAWIQERPVAQVSLRWRGPRNAQVAHRFPNCPEVHGLGVVAPFRRQGIASRLLEVLEDLARSRERRWIGLGVAAWNEPARSLYLYRGYTFADVPPYIDSWNEVSPAGTRIRKTEQSEFMLKLL
jgi:GNAT superfamily N-acetyltransferase